MLRSHPVWGAWVEVVEHANPNGDPLSHPVWDAWVEINGYSRGKEKRKCQRKHKYLALSFFFYF